MLALRPSLLAMRLALLAKLYGMGWSNTSIDEIDGRMYAVDGRIHIVVLHKPRNLQAILIGGSHDGAVMPTSAPMPSLTLGVISCTAQGGEGCECYSCDDCLPDDDNPEWSCWQQGAWRATVANGVGRTVRRRQP